MNGEAIHGHGPLGDRRPAWALWLAAAVGGLLQVTVGFFTVTAIGLVSIPLWAGVVLVGAWVAAAAFFLLTARRRPVLALTAPVVNGLVLWGVIAAGEAWLGWSG